MKITKIVVPLDGSSLAEEALAPAADLARRYGATLRLVRVVDMTWLLGQGVLTAPMMLEEADGYLRAIARDLECRGIHVDTAVWRGAAAPSIVDAAVSWEADLIVMTTHGRGGMGRLVMGSVADHVLHRTTTPILLLHATGAMPTRPAGEARAAVSPLPPTAPWQP